MRKTEMMFTRLHLTWTRGWTMRLRMAVAIAMSFIMSYAFCLASEDSPASNDESIKYLVNALKLANESGDKKIAAFCTTNRLFAYDPESRIIATIVPLERYDTKTSYIRELYIENEPPKIASKDYTDTWGKIRLSRCFSYSELEKPIIFGSIRFEGHDKDGHSVFILKEKDNERSFHYTFKLGDEGRQKIGFFKL